MRRHGRSGDDVRKIVISGRVGVDLDRHEVEAQGKKVEQTPTDFRILELLASRRGRIQSRDQILTHLWGDEKYVIDRTVDVHIRHLREQLGNAAHIIKNVRGAGYRVEE